MKRLFSLFVVLALIMLTVVSLSGCRTDYYEPKGKKFTNVNKKIYGPVKSEGMISWSNGVGKNLPLSNPTFSVISK